MLKRFLIKFTLFFVFLPFIEAVHAEQIPSHSAQFEGFWFSCEFAQRQRAPDDSCQMFDDEGFYFTDGTLHYVRMIGSQETACRSNKKGQCFKRNTPNIQITTKPVADIRISGDRLIARYWGCEQSYFMQQNTNFMTIKPLKKNCLWSQERHFYVAPYDGKVTIVSE